MAASTRSGFTGGIRGGDGPTDTQSARTLYGHDLHLDRAAIDGAAKHVSTTPAEAPTDAPVDRPITVEEEITAPTARQKTRSHHSGKSRFPALARLFGRWNTLGNLEQHRDRADLELDEIPRERFLRPLAIVVATAAISFFIVVGLLKLRDSTGASEPPLAAPARAVIPAPARPPPAPPATARALVPAAQPLPTPLPAAPRPSLARAVAAEAVAAQPARRRASLRRPARPAVPLDPDSPMPLSF